MNDRQERVSYMTSAKIPPEEIALSDRLRRKIIRDIAFQDGWMSFAEYMDRVLYEPALGYYSGGSVKFGRDGDFVTAPEISTLYGRTLAQAILPILEQTGMRILEFGAGTGKLARDIMDELAEAGRPAMQYSILELSGELRQRQQQTLAGYDAVCWLTALPERFDGVVIANEVLDAIPVQLVVRRGGSWHELGVACEDGELVMRERPADDTLSEAIACRIPDADGLAEGYITEIHTRASGFVRTLADMLALGNAGAVVLSDYGFPAHEYYHPDRSSGTLMCHYRHQAHTDPFHLPGLEDVTAHVDFTAVAREAERGGLDVLCYANQAAFLIGAGLLERLGKETKSNTDDSVRLRAIQTLLSPTEMGELFKVMVLGHRIRPPAFMSAIDRSGRL